MRRDTVEIAGVILILILILIAFLLAGIFGGGIGVLQ